jgi:predicted N-formylglutamate amidohydrolase
MTGAESGMSMQEINFGEVVRTTQTDRQARFLIVCEHASNRIPAGLDNLGLSDEVVQSHVAWDPGALGVAQALLAALPGALVEGAVSRLVYDCNRPPDAPSAIPAQSEIYAIAGNAGLSQADRDLRTEQVYRPFARAITEQIEAHRDTLQLMVTVHSFTPVFNGRERAVEIGILHGEDPSFAQAMMAHRPTGAAYDIRLNEPYDASDGVAHTLDVQGARHGLANVMIEIRNDLIRSPEQQNRMGAFLAGWIETTLRARKSGEGAP